VRDREVLILVSLDVIAVFNSDDTVELVLSNVLICEFGEIVLVNVVVIALNSENIEAIVVSDDVCFDVLDEELFISVSVVFIAVFNSDDMDESVLPEFVSRVVLE
jgi:hypothetical protein